MSFATDTLRSLVSRLEVRTTAGNIVFDDPFEPEAPGTPPSLSNRLLRPTFVVYDSGGGEVYRSAKYGEPPVNLGPVLTFGGGLLGAWLLYRIVTGGR